MVLHTYTSKHALSRQSRHFHATTPTHLFRLIRDHTWSPIKNSFVEVIYSCDLLILKRSDHVNNNKKKVCGLISKNESIKQSQCFVFNLGGSAYT